MVLYQSEKKNDLDLHGFPESKYLGSLMQSLLPKDTILRTNLTSLQQVTGTV